MRHFLYKLRDHYSVCVSFIAFVEVNVASWMWSLMVLEDCRSFQDKQFNCNSPLLLPNSTLSHSGMHHYRSHFMLQWYLLSHRAKNKWGDCYVELSHEYMQVLAHTQRVVKVSRWLSARNLSDIFRSFAIHHWSRQCEDGENASSLCLWFTAVYNSGSFTLMERRQHAFVWGLQLRFELSTVSL